MRHVADLIRILDFFQVNLNGIVTLDREFSQYRNDFVFPFPLQHISPFYADVDTSTSGNVYFRYYGIAI